MYQQKQAVIISQHAVACHQLSCLLQNHGWKTVVAEANSAFHTIFKLNPSLFITDIEAPDCHGIALLQWIRTFNPATCTTALCRGGNTPAMRQARHAGVHGFFYLDGSGSSLDYQRGLTRALHRENENTRKPVRQIASAIVTGMSLSCHSSHTINTYGSPYQHKEEQHV